MATIFAANESTVLLNGEAVEGVDSIEYRFQQARQSIYALGSAERVGMASGAQHVQGRLRVVSSSPALNGLTGEEPFQITAQFRQGDTSMTVSFDDCHLSEKSFDMGASGYGTTLYEFTAARVREEEG
ncbi:MAG: hypothetical protein KTR29_25320 [Rhodothermaceae bacterium]|nr:hypothetical protein [Rhodothermaceae bacterium]